MWSDDQYELEFEQYELDEFSLFGDAVAKAQAAFSKASSTVKSATSKLSSSLKIPLPEATLIQGALSKYSKVAYLRNPKNLLSALGSFKKYASKGMDFNAFVFSWYYYVVFVVPAMKAGKLASVPKDRIGYASRVPAFKAAIDKAMKVVVKAAATGASAAKTAAETAKAVATSAATSAAKVAAEKQAENETAQGNEVTGLMYSAKAYLTDPANRKWLILGGVIIAGVSTFFLGKKFGWWDRLMRK